MKHIVLIAVTLALASTVSGQKTNDAIQAQLRSAKADKQITVSYDSGGSKMLAIGENFSNKEAKAANIQAMNFGMAVNYPGTSLSAAPGLIDLTFWVLSKKPRFAGNSHWVATIGGSEMDLGNSRYAAKGAQNMEYLNFQIKRDDLMKIANQPGVKFMLGKESFSFTPAHLLMFRNFLAASEVR